MTCPTCGEMDGDYIPCPVCGNCVSCHAEYHIACGSIDGIDAADLPAKYLDRPPAPINLKELNETIAGVLEDVVRQFVERRRERLDDRKKWMDSIYRKPRREET